MHKLIKYGLKVVCYTKTILLENIARWVTTIDGSLPPPTLAMTIIAFLNRIIL